MASIEHFHSIDSGTLTMKKTTKFFLKAVCFLLYSGYLPNPLLHAQQKDEERKGQEAASFLAYSPSVRASALGGAQAASSGCLDDMFSNPGSLVRLEIPELWMARNQSFEGTSYNALAFGVPLKGQALALSASYIDDGKHERIGRDAGNRPVRGLGDFRWTTAAFDLAYARQIKHAISMGLNLKLWKEDRALSSSFGWGSDVGLQLPVRRSLVMGLAYRNLGPRYRGHPLPAHWALGASYDLLRRDAKRQRIGLLGELTASRFSGVTGRWGLELSHQVISLRAGYKTAKSGSSDLLPRLSFGAGLRIRSLDFDYAWDPNPDLGDQHRFALRVGLGLTKQEREAKAHELDQAMENRMKARSAKHLAEGRAAFDRQDFEGAAAHFSQAAVWDTSNPESHELLKKAEDAHKQKQVNVHYQQGSKMAQKDQWLEAALSWKQALKLDPGHEPSRASLEKAEQKIRAFQQKRGLASKADEHVAQGIRHYLDGRYEAAIHEWELAAALEPNRDHLAEYIEKARNKRLQEEVKNLKEEKKSSDLEVDVMTQQAYTFYSLGKTDRAIELWQKVLVLDPENEDAKAALNQALKKKKLSEDDGDINPRVEEINAKALQSYSERRYKEAAALWRQALRLAPDNRWIQGNLRRAEAQMTALEKQ